MRIAPHNIGLVMNAPSFNIKERPLNWSVFFRAVAVAAISVVGAHSAATVISVPANQSSIQSAIDVANEGDTILVAPGTYFERINLRGKAIALRSQGGPQVTVIDGQSAGTVVTLDSSETRNTILEGFTISNGAASFGAGIYLLNSSATIRRNVFFNNRQDVGGFGAAIAGFSGSPYVEANEFLGSSCDDQFLSGVLTFVNSSSPVIVNNIIHDNDCRAINMTLPEGTEPWVVNNTIVRNKTGVYIDHRVANAGQRYANNLIAFNGIGLEVVFAITAFDATWTSNLMFGNLQGNVGTTDKTGTNGNLLANPLFVASGSNNFRLEQGSPAIDVGSDVGLVLPTTDFYRSDRIQDGNGDGISRVDIGASEKIYVAVAPSEIPATSRLAILTLILLLCGVARLAPPEAFN
ncbi:MAG: right-handed parallel beta-helix repeat-containing protein [Casimicrobium sp.]